MRLAVLAAVGSSGLLLGSGAAYAADPDLDPAYANAAIDNDRANLENPTASAAYGQGPFSGSIAVAGVARRGDHGYDVFVARLGPDGQLDRSFSHDGVRLLDLANVWGTDRSDDFAKSAVIDADGRIIIAGLSNTRAGGDRVSHSFALRVSEDGRLDTDTDDDPESSFGSDGVVSLPCPAERLAPYPPDTSRVAVAMGCDPSSAAALYTRVAVLTRDGDLDDTLGGSVPTGVGPNDLTGFAVDDGGRSILIGGLLVTGYPQLATRLTLEGELDSSFGTGGTVSLPLASTAGVELDDTGRILTAGTAKVPGAAGSNFAVTRLAPTGELDLAFGSNGVASVDVWACCERAGALALDAHDRIVVAGSVSIASVEGTPEPDRAVQSMVVARFLSDGTVDTALSGDGIAASSRTWPITYHTSSLLLDGVKPLVVGQIWNQRSEDFADEGHPVVLRFAEEGPDHPPETTLRKTGRRHALKAGRALRVRVRSDEALSSLECALDGAEFGGCSRRRLRAPRAPGRHLLQARAVDRAGNVEPTPASVHFRVRAD